MKNETSYLLYIIYVCRHDIDIKFALRNYCSLRMRTLLLACYTAISRKANTFPNTDK